MVSKGAQRILITTGDPDGIGWEVTAKALNAIGPKRDVQFVYYRHSQSYSKKQPSLSRRFKHSAVTSIADVLRAPFDPKTAIEIRSGRSPAHWVEEAARLCMIGEFQALVTAPISKTSIVEAGFKDIGHTEILARVTGRSDLFMGFIGKHFSVVLASGHQPLQKAIFDLGPERYQLALRAAAQLRSLLPAAAKRKLPIALVGVNPHAGESGLLGSEEQWMRGFADQKSVVGPLVPDAAFLKENWARYSVYLCPYHDQGLIPFKLVHGFSSGVHLTLGLPFVRTSVDHGTAKELFGKNHAQFGSMKDALTVAMRLSKETSL